MQTRDGNMTLVPALCYTLFRSVRPLHVRNDINRHRVLATGTEMCAIFTCMQIATDLPVNSNLQ